MAAHWKGAACWVWHCKGRQYHIVGHYIKHVTEQYDEPYIFSRHAQDFKILTTKRVAIKSEVQQTKYTLNSQYYNGTASNPTAPGDSTDT
jgi:hypothetical protein